MSTSSASAVTRRQKFLIAGTLVLFAALAWADLVRRAGGLGASGPPGMAMGEGGMDQPPLALEGALFLGMWTTMMVAMMFPAAVPMVYTFATIHRRHKEQGSAYVPTWVFVAAYLLLWGILGLPAFAASTGLEALRERVTWLGANGGFLVGGVVALAGLYQLSPLKYACLSRCRSPLSFLLSSWRPGYGGALLMGLRHGWYCVGCCWMLFVIMVAVGVMNLAWMGALALLIFAEKLVPRGVLVSRVSGVLLLAVGAAVAVTGL